MKLVFFIMLTHLAGLLFSAIFTFITVVVKGKYIVFKYFRGVIYGFLE